MTRSMTGLCCLAVTLGLVVPGAEAQEATSDLAQVQGFAESILAREEAASERAFDPAFRAKAKELLATLPLAELLAQTGDDGLGLNSLGDTQADLVYSPVTPCRIVDTRVAGRILSVGVPRGFRVTGTNYSDQGGSATSCGVPYGPATAVVINLVAVTASGPGNLKITPYGQALPTASIINYATVQNVANGVAVAICNPAAATCTSDVTIQANVSQVHLVVDIQGYFRNVSAGGVSSALLADAAVTAPKIAPGVVVRSLNSQTDAVTLAGANGLSVSQASGTVTVTSSATATNTPSTIVARDASGNFSAGTITGSLNGSATTATGFTGSLAGEVTGPQVATVVPNAVSANTASAIVRRDGTGGFLAGTVGLAGNLALPNATAASTGVLTVGGARFLHNFGSQNTFVGAEAGNFTLAGVGNAAFGYQALSASTTGFQNSAFGAWTLGANTTGAQSSAFGAAALALNTTGSYNSAFGFGALYSNTSAGSNSGSNSAFGFVALYNNTTGSSNSAFGYQALSANTTGDANSVFGSAALESNTTGHSNSAVGVAALEANTTGNYNSAVGYQALSANTTGTSNVAVGSSAGANLTSGNSNIYIANPGATTESNTIRIGTVGTHVATFIAGISGVSPGGSALPVVVDANGQLGTGSAGGAGDITAVNTPAGGGLQGGATSGDVNLGLLTCGSGQVLKSNGASWSCAADTDTGVNAVVNGGGVTGSITGRTLTFGSTATATNTAGAIVARDGTGGFQAGSVGLARSLDLPSTASATVGVLTMGGVPFIHNFGLGNTFVGADTGNFSLTGQYNSAFGVTALTANTTGMWNTAVGNQALAANTAGYRNSAVGFRALVSNTTAWDNSAFGVNTLASNTTGFANSAFGSQALRANTTGQDNAAFGVVALQSNTTGNGNSAFGLSALSANTDGSVNSAFGNFALYSNTTAGADSAFGYAALYANTTGYQNSAFGYQALHANTTGASNSAFGSQALYNSTGSRNIAVGEGAGSNLTSGDFNIDIGDPGVDGDSGVIRIGGRYQATTYIGGISGATVSGSAVFVNLSGQLGTTTSSRRYKEQIVDIAGESDVLLKLRPVSFYYRPELDETHIQQYGLVAEEVAEVAPGLVEYDKDGEPQTVRYHFVNAMLLNEVQKQRRHIQDLEERLAKLEAARGDHDSSVPGW